MHAACCSAASAFALCSAISLSIDLPVARYLSNHSLPGDLQRVLTWSEVAAHGLGVLILTGVVCVLDPMRRLLLPRLLAGALGAGLCANVMKLVTARIRPRFLELETSVFDTFTGWLPMVFPMDGRSASDSKWLSFPSGHTAVAVAFAIGLARIYPRGRWLFGLIALLAACQRLEVGAHYVSDTLAAAAIGSLFMIAVGDPNFLGRWFDRIERSCDNDESVSVLD